MWRLLKLGFCSFLSLVVLTGSLRASSICFEVYEILSSRSSPASVQTSLAEFQAQFPDRKLESWTNEPLLKYEDISPVEPSPEQIFLVARTNLGLSRLSHAQRQSLIEAFEYGSDQAGVGGKLPYQIFSWTSDQVMQKREILSRAFSADQIDGALRAIRVHPSSGQDFSKAEIESLNLVSSEFSDPRISEDNLSLAESERRPEDLRAYALQTNLGRFHLQHYLSDFARGQPGHYRAYGLRMIGNSGATKGNLRYRIHLGYGDRPDHIRISPFESRPDLGGQGTVKLLLESLLRLHPEHDQLSMSLPADEGLGIELSQLLRENPEPDLAQLTELFPLFATPGLDFRIEAKERSGGLYWVVHMQRNSAPQTRLVDRDKIFESESAQSLWQDYQDGNLPLSRNPTVQYPGSRDLGPLPSSYDFSLIEHKDFIKSVQDKLSDADYRAYENQLQQMMASALEVMSDETRNSSNQSISDRIESLILVDGTTAAYYRSLFFEKGVDPHFEATVVEGLTRKADAIYFDLGGAFDAEGRFRETEAYDLAFIQAQDEALARAGIRALDSSRLNDPEYLATNLSSDLINRLGQFGSRWLDLPPEGQTFRGTVDSQAFQLLISEGYALREYGMPFHSPMRRGERSLGGHGRDFHLLQILLAMEAIDSTHGQGTFARVYREEIPYYYDSIWVPGFEGGTNRIGTSILMPMLRVYGQNPQTQEDGRPIQDPNGPPGRVLIEAPPALPFIR
ncbi:MAG: hypothetical protein EA369_07075 [Bradymonadales bacterium]|nr:MAG: hypothetical protein EA369_07075 [Bradymonadales bacterium]